jgi:hypothetical protein
MGIVLMIVVAASAAASGFGLGIVYGHRVAAILATEAQDAHARISAMESRLAKAERQLAAKF